MIEQGITPGEQLCHFIDTHLLARGPWGPLAEALKFTGRSGESVALFRQIGAVAMTGRIVSAGKSYSKESSVADSLFQSRLRMLLREHTGIENERLNSLYRFSIRAIEAAVSPFPNGVQRQMRSWAERKHVHCYICGGRLEFDSTDHYSSYTCDHIWPRGYGGTSDPDNLLPACRGCNNEKKGKFATWVMPAIQALVLGVMPAEERLEELDGKYKFALHYRAAQQHASNNRLTLKAAFLQLGPWTDIRIVDEADVVDFFNLANHQQS